MGGQSDCVDCESVDGGIESRVKSIRSEEWEGEVSVGEGGVELNSLTRRQLALTTSAGQFFASLGLGGHGSHRCTSAGHDYDWKTIDLRQARMRASSLLSFLSLQTELQFRVSTGGRGVGSPAWSQVSLLFYLNQEALGTMFERDQVLKERGRERARRSRKEKESKERGFSWAVGMFSEETPDAKKKVEVE